MTVRTRAQLNSDADANLPDNTSGDISPADLRGSVKNLADSALLAEDFGAGFLKAWINFDGTGTVAIRGSGNVSSLTDNGTGNYSVNFTTAMADTNYAVVSSSWSSTFVSAAGPYSRSTSAVSVKTSSASGGNMQATTFADATDICLAVFR